MSPGNTLRPLKWYRKLEEGKHRLEEGAFLVEGARAVQQVFQAAPGEIMEAISVAEPPEYLRHYPLSRPTAEQFASISATRTPQGIAVVVRLPEGVYSDSPPEEPGERILLLEGIQDPGNTGTLIRTAAAFDFSGVILSAKCADPFSPKCVQSTAGSVLSVWLRRTGHYRELVKEFKESGHVLLATDVRGDADLQSLEPHGRLVLALGNEAAGLSSSILSEAYSRIRIPINRDRVESLNVAASGAICIYAISAKRRFSAAH